MSDDDDELVEDRDGFRDVMWGLLVCACLIIAFFLVMWYSGVGGC